jgi:hypothetical protein
MYIVVDRLVEALASGGNAILSADRLGSRKPAAGIDVPAIVVEVNFQTAKGAGLGRFVRAGESIVSATSIIEVEATVDTFSPSLKSLRISPLPLKRNPSSTTQNFSAADIQIRNVTDLSNPIDYTFVEQPTSRTEYKLNRAIAEIVFGSPQIAGEKLEVSHWTVTWRDEILGDKYSGSISIEVWENSFNLARDLSRRLQDKLQTDRALLRTKGFQTLQPLTLGPIENVSQPVTVGSAFSAWKQKLEYRFAFEAEDGGELSSGVPIKRIDVEMDDFIVEEFSVT